MENYFRYWKKLTNIESKRYKAQKVKDIFTKFKQNIYNQKLQYFYRWIYASTAMGKKVDDNDIFSNYH